MLFLFTLVFQSNECGSSYSMEKEGLARALAKISDSNLEVDTITTDRHPQIAKYIRTEYPEIIHLYDVWHVAKGDFHAKISSR